MLQTEFGVHGTLTPLVSERDQNFRVETADGRVFVCKIANASEPQQASEFQLAALLHIEQQDCPVATPRVQRNIVGGTVASLAADAAICRCRVVSYVPGNLLSSVTLDNDLAAQLGTSAAHLDLALQGFAHAGQPQELPWDPRRAGALRDILQYTSDVRLRDAVRACIDDFETRVQPALAGLRHQVIHADLNPDNVVIEASGKLAGVIDFGDMLHAPLVFEVAIAASYLRPGPGRDVLEWIEPFVAAYQSVLPLQDGELALLFDLLRTRLAATISILNWRAAVRGAGDAYSRQNLLGESDAPGFLEGLDALGRDKFFDRIRKFIKNK